jgi:hypothetical protein
VAIVNQRETPATTFHVTVDDYYSMIDVTRLIARDYGSSFRHFGVPEVISQMNRLCTRAAAGGRPDAAPARDQASWRKAT